MKRNQKGFTLIEIIAVLVILGILAAVAVPKYMDLQAESKKKAAQGQVAEMKGTLSSAWGKYFMDSGKAPSTITQVVAKAGYTAGTAFDVGTAPDIWNVTIATTGLITVNNRNADTGYTATGTWNLPN